jgi:hypothetical protein
MRDFVPLTILSGGYIVWQKQDAGNNGYAWSYEGNSLSLYENRTIIPFTDVGFKIIFG